VIWTNALGSNKFGAGSLKACCGSLPAEVRDVAVAVTISSCFGSLLPHQVPLELSLIQVIPATGALLSNFLTIVPMLSDFVTFVTFAHYNEIISIRLPSG
jgi:hypothetical protein